MQLRKKVMATAILCSLVGSAAGAQDQKPGVVILATGGTIAGTAKSKTDTMTYQVASMGVQALIDAVPEMKEVATVSAEQVANVNSDDIDQGILLRLARTVNKALSDNAVHGVVVTHGTDTLEETAFFLDLTTAGPKPVVVVGAMRPASAISADGPMNLLQAVTLAANKDAERRGAMVVLNDRIGSAFYITKSNTTAVDTFRSTEQGYLGAFVGATPKFYYSPANPVGKPTFDVSSIHAFPKVSIVYMHEDQDVEQIDAAIRSGAKGIVIAGAGNGGIPLTVKNRLTELTASGFPVIRASRTGSGFTTKKTEGIAAGTLNPQKARILLMLALSQQSDISTIRTYFNE
ncbi:asparaginase (plasmid) [Cupriavidus pinatubonensis]|nr:asparaginase [Cupriavidus pinatubonensis]